MELLSYGDDGWGDEMLRATWMTLAVSLAAFALGIVVGTLTAAVKLARLWPLHWIAHGYTTVARGVPELLVIYLFFFGGSNAAMFFAGFFGYEGYVELNAFTIGAVAVGLISGSYSAEVIRGAIQAVPTGQIEAAQALGMGRWLRYRRVMLPQIARYALPGLGNVWQFTLKDSALISVTGLVEIMRQAHVASGSTRAHFLFFTTAAALFLLLTSFSNAGFRRAELWANKGVRR